MSTYLTGIDTTIHPEDEMLLNAVSGLTNVGLAKAVYFRQGYEINSTLQTILDWSAGSKKSEAKVLDFACGYGRATRFLVAQVSPRNVWVSDIYEEAVKFQIEQFGVNGFVSCYEPAELRCEEKFDLIFVTSLFTHLPQARFEQWIHRLYNLLLPEGVLAFSVHDQALAGGRIIPSDGFLFVPESESRSLDENEYGSTYVTEQYVASVVRKITSPTHNFKRLPLALCGSHDIYLISRNAQQDFSTLAYTQPPVGYVDWFSLSAEGVFRIGGWAGEHDSKFAISNISVSINQKVVANLKPSFERADVVRALGIEHFSVSGWDFSMPGIDKKRQGSDTVEVVLTSTTGKTAILHSSLMSDAALPVLPPVQSSPKGLVSRILSAIKRPAGF